MPLVRYFLRRGYAAIRVARVLDITRLLWVPPESMRRIEIPTGYQVCQPNRSECSEALSAGKYRTEIGRPEWLDDPRNALLVAHRNSELAAYVWFVSGAVDPSQNYSRAPHLGTPIRLPPGVAFAYNAWTAPSHRGRRLMPALLSHAVASGCCGGSGLVTTTDWTNTAALTAFDRVGFSQLGLIYRLGPRGCNATWAPETAAALGIEVGVEIAGNTSFPENSTKI